MIRVKLAHAFVQVPTSVANVEARGLARLLRVLTRRPTTYQVVVATRSVHAQDCIRCMVERRTAARRKKR